ncbi:MAG: alpha/beta hydrolase [bacterium]|nr:alpha/beta hydrolase [bacterium]
MNIVFGILFVFIFLFLWVRWQERSGLFFPARDLYISPTAEGLAFEDVHFNSAGNELHGWYIPASGDQVVLWMHGNAGNIADRLDQAVEMKRSLGVSSLMFDYRGYGKSEGRPSEKGLYQDAEAAFKWLTGTMGFDPGNIILYGHSLGSAVSVDLALSKGVSAGGMVLESPFTSAADVARTIYFGLPVGLVMSVKLDNIGRIGEVKMPILVIHGVSDTVIPFRMGKEVFDAAPEPKTFLSVAGGDHSDCYIVGGADYWNAWKRLLQHAARSTQNKVKSFNAG